MQNFTTELDIIHKRANMVYFLLFMKRERKPRNEYVFIMRIAKKLFTKSMHIKFPDESLRIKTKHARIVACRNINQKLYIVMNANKTLSTLEKEYNRVVTELREESLPSMFCLVPCLVAGTDEGYYFKFTYPIYERHNNRQQAKVDRLNYEAVSLYGRIMRIKNMSALRRFFVA